MMFGKRLGAVMVAMLIPVGLFAVSGTAVAKTKAPKPALQCSVTGTFTISPGLSNTPAKQTLTVTLQLVNCTNSSVPGITGDSASTSPGVTSKTTETCANLTEEGKPTTTKNAPASWNNGDSSTFTYKTTLGDPGPGQSTASGKVVSGDFKKGKIAALISDTPGPGQNCSTTPLTSGTISGSFNIT
jgi:hypothetical protein